MAAFWVILIVEKNVSVLTYNFLGIYFRHIFIIKSVPILVEKIFADSYIVARVFSESLVIDYTI